MLPLIEELSSLLTSWQVFLALQHRAGLLFLDSALKHSTLGRYSFITALPFAWIQSRGQSVTVKQHMGDTTETVSLHGNPFEILAQWLEPSRHSKTLPPGGAAGLFAYDLCHHVERLPRPEVDEFALPEMAVGLYDVVFAFDHIQQRSWLISTGYPETDPQRQRVRAAQRLTQFRQMLTAPIKDAPSSVPAIPLARSFPVPGFDNLLSSFSKEEYLKVVRRAIEYVHAGDCFQVNLAQRLVTPATSSSVQLYAQLRECNPAPFAGCFHFGDSVLLTASPERFLRVNQRTVETRPIKGTRPCGKDPVEDERLRSALMTSAKDRAENVMIVDLLRNDLGRVCEYGSIQVDQLCGLETYRYVHHLVSVVLGRLRPDCTALDLFQAAFPGGSITGAPKVRAMEIIAELEPTCRGPYCGSLGYFGFDGNMDTNLLIRTFTQSQGWLQFPVGGGIVADSVAEDEYAETLHKGEGLIRTLQLSDRERRG